MYSSIGSRDIASYNVLNLGESAMPSKWAKRRVCTVTFSLVYGTSTAPANISLPASG